MQVKDYIKYLCCPTCKGEVAFNEKNREINCKKCFRRFPIVEGILCFLPLRGDDVSLKLKGDCPNEYDQGMSYDNKYMAHGIPREEIERMSAFKYLDIRGKDISILDLGGGTGRCALYAADLCIAKIFVVDININLLKWGREKAHERGFRDIVWVLADVRCLPFKENTFDRIISLELLEHLPQQIELAVQEIKRTLKKSGIAAVNIWNAIPRLLSLNLKIEYWKGGNYYKFYFPGEFKNIFKNDFEKCYVVGSYFIYLHGLIRRVPGVRSSKKLTLQLEYFIQKYFPWVSRIFGGFLLAVLEK